MINPTEILAILQMNGLDKNSSLQDVKTFLGQINYNEEDKAQVIAMLKSQGWVLTESTHPVGVAIPSATTVSPVSTDSPVTQTSSIMPTPEAVSAAFASLATESAPAPTPSSTLISQSIPEPEPVIEPTPEPVMSTPEPVVSTPPPAPEPVASIELSPAAPAVETPVTQIPITQAAATTNLSRPESQAQTPSTINPYQHNNVMNMSVPQKTGGAKTLVISIIVIIVVLLLCGTVSYAYINKIGPFALSSYTEDNISSGMLAKIAGIDSASYTFSGALNVVSRESDALPFTLKVSNEKDLKQKYYYDGERMKNAHDIIFSLNSDAGYYAYSLSTKANSSAKPATKSYPSSIDNLFTTQRPGYSSGYSIIDPESNNAYQYQVTEGGKDFTLTVDFATDDAIKAVKGYGYKATSTIVEGRRVIFTKDSSVTPFFSSEPPKPFLSQMSDSLSMLPPEINAKIALSASSEFKPQQMANWSFNLDAQGDFGDMTYKINADALRKDDNYYFKINNIPSFFLFNQLAVLKGKWIVVPSKTATSSATSTATSSDAFSSNYSPFSSIQNGIPDTEAKYKENRDKFVKFIKKTVAIADEQKIFIFKNKPSAETVDGRNLVKYEIGFRKDKILSFYTSIQDMVKNDPELSDYANYFDQGYLDYLKSDEFSQVFDYADKNSKLTIWTDSQGYPAVIQNVSRVVPPDSAIQLKDKQINLTVRLDVSNINKPTDIQAPANATSLDKITSDFKDASLTGDAGLKGQAAMVKNGLYGMRAQAELIYSQSSNSYGKKPFTLGPCKLTSGTLFGDSAFSKLLNSVTKNNPALAVCVASGSAGDVTSWAVSAPIPGDDGFSWCVDSTGMSKRIIDSLKGESCK